MFGAIESIHYSFIHSAFVTTFVKGATFPDSALPPSNPVPRARARPSRLHLSSEFTIIHLFFRFKNRPNMTFDDATAEPDQVFELQKDSGGLLEYTTK